MSTMKKVFSISLLCMALMIAFVTCTFAADFVLTSEIPAEISITDAKTKEFSVSGTYDANTEISLQIKNVATGKVVLYQQATTAEDGSFTVSGIMSDAVEAGSYELKLGATNMAVAKDYYFDTIEVVNEATVSITSPDANVSIKVNGEDKGTANGEASYEIGTVLTLTAPAADETQEFLYWQDGVNGVIISTELEIEVVVGSTASYKAVYADKTGEEILVVFKSNNKVLVAGAPDSIAIPQNPYIAGYTFEGWYDASGKPVTVNLGEVTENTIYTVGFKADKTKYQVTVEGANEASGEYAYNEKVVLTAKADEENNVFTHWTKDGIIVSYNSEYSFYVSGATEVVAHYAETAAEAQIVLAMAAPVMIGSDRIAFYAERNIPEEYTVIETGILLSQEDNFDINSGAIKAKAKSTANIGQYTVRKANVSAGDTWNAKAYLIYKADGEIFTVYSDMVSMTAK